METEPMRYALAPAGPRLTAYAVAQYLPSNYECTQLLDETGEPGAVLIHGYDAFGWGLHTYVLPRLASGLIRAYEVSMTPVAD